jgi:sec-independent protein translocase protein TatC
VRIGLTRQERGWGAAFVGWGSLLFVSGVAFAYAVLLPASLRILLGIGRGTLEPVISIDRYLSFAIGLLGWCGAVFELPVVIFVLAKVGIVTPEWLRQQRPIAILLLVIASALMTPTTDVVNQLLLVLPMVLLYEASIPLSRLAKRWR